MSWLLENRLSFSVRTSRPWRKNSVSFLSIWRRRARKAIMAVMSSLLIFLAKPQIFSWDLYCLALERQVRRRIWDEMPLGEPTSPRIYASVS